MKRAIGEMESRLARNRVDLEELTVLKRERLEHETKTAHAIGDAERAQSQLQGQMAEFKRLRDVEAQANRLETLCQEKERSINVQIANVGHLLCFFFIS